MLEPFSFAIAIGTKMFIFGLLSVAPQPVFQSTTLYFWSTVFYGLTILELCIVFWFKNNQIYFASDCTKCTGCTQFTCMICVCGIRLFCSAIIFFWIFALLWSLIWILCSQIRWRFKGCSNKHFCNSFKKLWKRL